MAIQRVDTYLAWRPDVAIERIARAMRLSPHDPQIAMMHAATACRHFFAGRDLDALLCAEKSIRMQPNYFIGAAVVAASNILTGKQSICFA